MVGVSGSDCSADEWFYCCTHTHTLIHIAKNLDSFLDL